MGILVSGPSGSFLKLVSDICFKPRVLYILLLSNVLWYQWNYQVGNKSLSWERPYPSRETWPDWGVTQNSEPSLDVPPSSFSLSPLCTPLCQYGWRSRPVFVVHVHPWVWDMNLNFTFRKVYNMNGDSDCFHLGVRISKPSSVNKVKRIGSLQGERIWTSPACESREGVFLPVH